MVSLIAKSPFEGLLPVAEAGMTLSEVMHGTITSVAPFRGQEDAAAAALAKAGLGWPSPGTAIAGKKGAVLWTGRGQAFLLGAAAPAGLERAAALTDQSDAWAAMRLAGAAGPQALARLVAVDLSPEAFPVGAVARTGLYHMMSVLWRSAPDAIDILVFRSMAATAVHEIGAAMTAVTARASV